MKKIILIAFSISILIPNLVKSQSLGFSAYALGFFPKAPVPIDESVYQGRTMGHTSTFSPGVRIEANCMMIGTSPAKFGYTGLGFSYFLPHSDSAFYQAKLKSGFTVPVVATTKTTCSHISLRFAYDIPQTFNEFISIHIGVGMGFLQYKTQNILPEKSTTFNHDASEFDASNFTPVRSGDISMEVLVGALYELEKFSVVGQYSYVLGMDRMYGKGNRHGLTVGIYYPLKKF
ncbi:MAG: hypothetical protein NT084_11590 [Bacteroidetes bacterium]|nr:hypothetical protein [Bacteroidota bacterium]